VTPHPSRSPITWLLALVFLCGIDAAITRTSLLWGETAFEHGGGPRLVFPQTYQVARKLYAPAREADVRVALLGNSRVVLALKEHRLEAAIAAIRPGRDLAVSNLGIFGSFMGETAMLARHLDALEPDVVVVAVGAPDLQREPVQPGGAAMDVLRIGLRDGPIPVSGWGERLDRWLRTLWPLYRFREFAREAILDRVLRRTAPAPPPEEFATREALFAHLYGDRAGAVAAAFRGWQREGGIAAYARYLEAIDAGHLERGKARARSREPLTRDTPAVVAFEALLGELERSGRPRVVLLMPENPILEEDTAGEFHRPGLSDEAARLVEEIAVEHAARVLDARTLLPTPSFLDFDHPVLEVDALERALAQEVVDAARL
jgi:hypothetical protein